MDLVDTHCHLFFEKLAQNEETVLERAAEAGVGRMICVGTSLADSRQAAAIAQKHENIWAAVGAHPHEAEDFLSRHGPGKILNELSILPKVSAIGEIGLDYYKSRTPADIQEKAFRAQIEAGYNSDLPFIFHVRDAWRDFWRIFDEYKNLHGVVHSFSSGTKQLDEALERGLYIGLNGIMTFTKDEAQLEAARRVPLERLLLETDAPFLAPVPFRGEVCEPKYVLNVAEFLAGLRSQSLSELCDATTDNAVRLFNLK